MNCINITVKKPKRKAIKKYRPDKPQNCKHCSKDFKKKHILVQHITAYHSVFFCQSCGYRIVGSQSKECKEHEKKCPWTLKPDTQCHYCPLRIEGNQELLKNH